VLLAELAYPNKYPSFVELRSVPLTSYEAREYRPFVAGTIAAFTGSRQVSVNNNRLKENHEVSKAQQNKTKQNSPFLRYSAFCQSI
jgi:hypothetical protein